MAGDDTSLTPLGELLEAGRGDVSKREAARRAGISEGRWRQIVTGQQKAGGGITLPANPRRETVMAMAAAVGVDVDEALRRAGMGPREVRPEPPQIRPGTSDVRTAIMNDGALLEEARAHLLNQYELLRRLSPAADSNEDDRASTQPAQRPLRAAARRGKPEKS